MPAIVVGGFAAQRLGHTIQCNDIDIFAYVLPWFDPSTLPWRFGPCFHNVYSETHVPEELGWPPSLQQSNFPPNVTWYMKHYPVCEYSHCDFGDAIQMCVVECVISHPGHPYNTLLFCPYERPFVFKFVLLKARSEDQCLKL